MLFTDKNGDGVPKRFQILVGMRHIAFLIQRAKNTYKDFFGS